MPVSSGRTHKRIAKVLAVELAHQDPTESTEKAVAQNVSSGGLRVATEHAWHPGDTVLVTSAEIGIHNPARVVYCQRLNNCRFAVGLELERPGRVWQ